MRNRWRHQRFCIEISVGPGPGNLYGQGHELGVVIDSRREGPLLVLFLQCACRIILKVCYNMQETSCAVNDHMVSHYYVFHCVVSKHFYYKMHWFPSDQKVNSYIFLSVFLTKNYLPTRKYLE